jgi:16S rRNA G966 N2-methylase RsmD
MVVFGDGDETEESEETRMKSSLYFGDNLEILRAYIKDESVDLIYLDPPF